MAGGDQRSAGEVEDLAPHTHRICDPLMSISNNGAWLRHI